MITSSSLQRSTLQLATIFFPNLRHYRPFLSLSEHPSLSPIPLPFPCLLPPLLLEEVGGPSLFSASAFSFFFPLCCAIITLTKYFSRSVRFLVLFLPSLSSTLPILIFKREIFFSIFAQLFFLFADLKAPLFFSNIRMKGGYYGLRAKEISLITIVLMCATIFLWMWERTPILTNFRPPRARLHSSSSELQRRIEQTVETEYSRQEEQSLDFVPLGYLAHNGNSVYEAENFSATAENQACNYAKGKWNVSDTLPRYDGNGCKQWLSGMWSCHLNGRADLAYEKLKWQPDNCQMEEFEGSKFLTRMKQKTLAFVGDSLGRQQFQSLMCMITAGKERDDVLDVGEEYGLAMAPADTRPNGWAYRFIHTNTTILYYWSASLCDLEPINKTKPETEYAMHLDRPPAFLRQFIHKFDVLVLNTGHHWNRGKINANRWVMYVGGKQIMDKKLAMIGNAKNLTVHSIIRWVNSQLPKYPGLRAFYRTISPRHFVGGEWNTGGSCDNTTPMSIGKQVTQEESSDESAASAVKGTKVELLDITALSQLRDEGHISKFSMTASEGVQDCLHWCLPGVPDTWNEILFAQI